jgi:hypothetical protein
MWDIWRSVASMVAPHIAFSGSNATDSVQPAQTRLQVTDHDLPGAAHAATRLPAPLSPMLTMELDGAADSLGISVDELLLAAFGRAVARTIGTGVVSVDMARDGRAVLHPVQLTCLGEREMSADDLVRGVHRTLAAMPHRAIRHGILHYFGTEHPASEVFFHDLGEQLDSPEQPVTGHALELRLFRTMAGQQLEWWYDGSRFDRVTVLELSEQFPFALIELTSEATAVV